MEKKKRKEGEGERRKEKREEGRKKGKKERISHWSLRSLTILPVPVNGP